MSIFASLLLLVVSQAEEQSISIQDLLGSVVRIEQRVANVLDPSDRGGGHGTGFIVELSKTKGVIFTNNHVVDSPSRFHASQLRIVFNIPEALGTSQATETIEGKLVYQSPLHDFAVLEFDPRKLKRAKTWLRVVPGLVEKSESQKYATPMRPVLAIGNPLDSQNSFTDGRISTVYRDPSMGYFLQTNAAINPGNSGGPLFDLETGQVLGINTMKNVEEGVDNVGWALPIWVAVEDYEKFKSNRDHAKPRALIATYSAAGEDEINRVGLKEIIESRFPKYFQENDSVTRVDHFAKPFESGDFILAINGTTFGSRIFDLKRIVHEFEGSKIPVTVLRRGKIIDLKAPIIQLAEHQGASATKFVMASGMLFTNNRTLERHFIPEARTGVRVSAMIEGGVASQIGIQLGLAVIHSIVVDGTVYPVRKLDDLYKALNGRQTNTKVTYQLNAPVISMGENGPRGVRDADGFLMMQPKLSSITIPLGELVSDKEFNLREFRKQFDHDFANPERNNWRNFSRCASAVRRLPRKS